MVMLSESEVRNWKDMEKDRLSQTVDPTEHAARCAVISVLDGVLND